MNASAALQLIDENGDLGGRDSEAEPYRAKDLPIVLKIELMSTAVFSGSNSSALGLPLTIAESGDKARETILPHDRHHCLSSSRVLDRPAVATEFRAKKRLC